MTQSRLGSFFESMVNIVIGFVINLIANFLILPLIGFHITLSQNLYIGLLYTIISVIRSYCIRRWFNSYIHNAAMKIGG